MLKLPCRLSLAAILLTSMVHPHSSSESIVPGIEVLLSEQLHLIRGKRIGLITNHTGVDRRLRHDIDAFIATPGLGPLGLVALFSPEHGIRGTVQAGEKVRNGVDEKTGIPVYSLYGEETQPTAEMLKEVDVLVYDIQDVGSRFYTYISTLGQCMEAAAGKKIPFIVLDRPNPLGGEAVEGPPLKPEFHSFVGAFPIPIRYGLTPGELAGFIKDTQKLDLDLSIVKLKHWRRSQWYDETGLVWVPPSPNIPTLEAALAYPGMCLVEGTNLSEGRGTTKSFELVGAPWIDGLKLAESLNRANLPGILFRATTFTPTFSKFSGETCHGIQLHVVDRKTFRPIVTAVAILKEIRSAYANQFQFKEKHFDRLAGSDELRKAVEQNLAVESIVAAWNASLKKFEALRRKYLLYP